MTARRVKSVEGDLPDAGARLARIDCLHQTPNLHALAGDIRQSCDRFGGGRFAGDGADDVA
jgi:hypothetical protein